MRITTTDGKVYDRPDMCGYCEMTTGGQHQWNCPAFPPEQKAYLVEIKTNVRIFKYDDEGNFIKELENG